MTKSSQQRQLALPALLAVLFVTGSLAIAPTDRPDDVFVPTAVALPSEEEPPIPDGGQGPHGAQPEAKTELSESDGHSLYGAFWEENLGQWPDGVLWALRGGAPVWLTESGLTVHGQEGTVGLDFVDGSARDVEIVELRRSTTSVFGASSITGARHADHLRVLDVWPGIDFDVHITDAGSVQYDFRVHPGADPADAVLEAWGAQPRIDDGALVLQDIRFAAPYTYQASGPVDSNFRIDGRQVAVDVGPYDASALLVIDPELAYGTLVAPYLGSSSHRVYESVETDDGTYLGGTIYEPYYYQSHPGVTAVFNQGRGYYAGFFIHLDPDDNALLAFVEVRSEYQYGYTYGYGLDVDEGGRVWLVGQVGGTTGNRPAGIPVVNGEPFSRNYYYDGFIARFAPGSSGYDLQYSSHIGGNYFYSYYDGVWDVVVNDDGTFWIGGTIHGTDFFPEAKSEVVDRSSHRYYSNVFLLLYKDGNIPQPEMMSMFGGNYVYYNSAQNIDTDANGDVYFAGTVYTYPYYGDFPTTPNALQPKPSGSYNYDHFYGKIDRQGTIQHLSYWGTRSSDGSVVTSGAKRGPDIQVVEVDEVVLVGTAGRCCIMQTDKRLAPDGFGRTDAFVSHIDFDEGLVFSTHVGSPGSDYAYGGAYDKDQDTYFIGGSSNRPIVPEKEFAEKMPRAEHNGQYDAFVTAIQPGLTDASRPKNSQESMVAYTMYVGNSYGYRYSHSYNVVYGLDISEQRSLLVSGTQGGHWNPEFSAPVTEDAIDNGKNAGYYGTGFFQKYKLLNGLDIHATDGETHAQTPAQGKYQTLTMTDVHVDALIDLELIPWVTPESLAWDLDHDGNFNDGDGPGPFTVRRDKEETLPVCVRAPPMIPGGLHVKTCMNIVFQNRIPYIEMRLKPEATEYADPLPVYRVGQDIWFDAGFTHDPEGDLAYSKIQWTPHIRNEAGGWEPDEEVLMGGQASLAVKARYLEPGHKRMTLTVEDALGARVESALSVFIVGEPPELQCAVANAVRQDRWIDLDVVAQGKGAPIDHWEFDLGTDLPPMKGDGAPPARLRSTQVLPAPGPATAALTVTDENEASSTCAFDLEAGPRQVTADFAWETPVAGGVTAFTDRSFPKVPEHPILAWEWKVDGVVVAQKADTEHVFAHPGVYDVSLTVTDGFDTDTYLVPIEVLPGPTAPVARIGAPSPPYHAGQQIQLTDESISGGAPIVNRTWTIGGEEREELDPAVVLPPGEHVVELNVSDGFGRFSIDEVTLSVLPVGDVVPEFTASTLEPVVGEPVLLSDTSRTGSTPIVDYEWSFSDGSRAAHGQDTQHVFWQPGVYDVTLTLHEAGGRRHMATHALTVLPEPEGPADGDTTQHGILPTADAGVDRRVLAGSVVLLDSSRSASQQSTFSAEWSQASGPTVALVPQDDQVSLRVPHLPGETIALSLVVTDIHGASAPDIVRLHIVGEHADGMDVVAPPAATFQVDRTDRAVRLVAPEHPIEARYVWDLGDGTTAEGREVVHEYVAHQAYDVSLQVVDVHGQEAAYRETIEVRSAEDLDAVHNASTPSTVLGIPLRDFVLASLLVGAVVATAVVLVRRP